MQGNPVTCEMLSPVVPTLHINIIYSVCSSIIQKKLNTLKIQEISNFISSNLITTAPIRLNTMVQAIKRQKQILSDFTKTSSY